MNKYANIIKICQNISFPFPGPLFAVKFLCEKNLLGPIRYVQNCIFPMNDCFFVTSYIFGMAPYKCT